MTLQRKLILTLVLLLIPLLGADLYYHLVQYKVRRQESIRRFHEHAEDLSRNMQMVVSRIVATQKSISSTIRLAHWNTPALREDYYKNLITPDSVLTNISIVDAGGRVVDGYPIVGNADIGDRDYFNRLKNGADWAVSDLLISRIDGQVGFVIATSVRENGKFAGAILTRMDENRVKLLLGLTDTEGPIFLLADRQGNLAFVSNKLNLPYQNRITHSDQLRLAPNSFYKTIQNASLFGQRGLSGVVVPVRDISWSAGALASHSTSVIDTYSDIFKDLLIILAIFAFTVVAGNFIIKQLSDSVVKLSAAAEKFGDGHFDTKIETPRIAEFATLANTMKLMAESIQQRDHALQQALQRESRISAAFQESMLPDVPSQIGKIEIASAYYPALQEAELGGDFYDVNIVADGLLGLLVADVSGKGLAAAVHTATAKYALQGFAYEDPDPARALQRVSAVLFDNDNTDKFVTAFFATVDWETGAMVYANAGHPPPLLLHSDGRAEWLLYTSGPPLGVLRNPDYTTHTLQLEEGDIMLSYTDGIIEARRHGVLFGTEQLEKVARECKGSLQQLVCCVYSSVSDYVQGDLQDDAALLAVRLSEHSHNGPPVSARRACDLLQP